MTSPSSISCAAADSSPIIRLDSLGYLQHLPSLTGQVFLAPAVASELRAGAGKPGSSAPELSWVELRSASPQVLELVRDELVAGAGEVETLALAVELGCTALLDDAQARRYAARKGVPFTGTLGILLDIHREGLAVRSAQEDLAQLSAAGMYLEGV
jgi:uncharacterized protein